MRSKFSASFAGILLTPSETVPAVLEQENFGSGLIVLLAGWLNILLSILLIAPVSLGAESVVVSLMMGMMFMSALFLMKVMGIHFFAELLGGKGSMTGLFAGLAWSMAPLHLGLPLTFLALGTRLVILIPVWIILLAWSSRLSVDVISRHYSLPQFRSALSTILPGIFSIMFMMCMAAGSAFLILYRIFP